MARSGRPDAEHRTVLDLDTGAGSVTGPVAPPPLPLTYVLPIRRDAVTPDPDLDRYLHRLAGEVAEVVVVDGSSPEVFVDHARRWGDAVRHLAPDVAIADPPDKPAGVVTGARAAGHDVVVVADDDVRWELPDLADAVRRMEGADLVRPHNRFDPMPWHARWDTGRTLLNRAFGGDWPGTLVVRRRYVVDGYGRGVLFENLELVRTVAARGGRVAVARDLVVVRRPPSAGWFLRQRVRQAYDEMARPWQLAWQLALLPVAALGGRRAVAGLGVAAVACAEVGRRRGGTARVPVDVGAVGPGVARRTGRVLVGRCGGPGPGRPALPRPPCAACGDARPPAPDDRAPCRSGGRRPRRPPGTPRSPADRYPVGPLGDTGTRRVVAAAWIARVTAPATTRPATFSASCSAAPPISLHCP